MIHNLNVSKNDNHPIPQDFQKNMFFGKKQNRKQMMLKASSKIKSEK